jgi:hypothetical protein
MVENFYGVPVVREGEAPIPEMTPVELQTCRTYVPKIESTVQ